MKRRGIVAPTRRRCALAARHPSSSSAKTRCLRFRQIAFGSTSTRRPVLNDDPRAADVAEEQQSEAELPPLKIAETERIIARLEQVVRDRRVVLVGGQAVAIWASKLEDRIADALVEAVASVEISTFSATHRTSDNQPRYSMHVFA